MIKYFLGQILIFTFVYFLTKVRTNAEFNLIEIKLFNLINNSCVEFIIQQNTSFGTTSSVYSAAPLNFPNGLFNY